MAGSVLFLIRQFLSDRAQPAFRDGDLVEVAVARLDRQLELHDRGLQVALPGIELRLMLMLQQLLAEGSVAARGELMQRAV